MESSASTNENPEVRPPVANVPVKRAIKWPFVLVGVVVILLGVAISYVLVNRSRAQGNTENAEESQTQTAEYKNPNGFAFKYPTGLQLVPNEDGVRLAGETEINFMVKPMEEPLEATVVEIADNFGIDESTPDFSMQTVNSRTGFVLNYENKDYLYFPLFGDYYLEIVMDELNQIGMEVLDTLEFTPPQASLN